METAADDNKRCAALADAQARCDAVAMAFGEHAPRTMVGELPGEYRRREAGTDVLIAGRDEDSIEAVSAVARANGAGVVIRDIGGFEDCGVSLVDPWQASSRRRRRKTSAPASGLPSLGRSAAFSLSL